MADSYAGAEASVDAQRKSALDALAQYGRRGLEAAVLAQKEGNQIQTDSATDNASFASDLGIGTAGQGEIAALTSPGQQAYARNGQQAVDAFRSETDALGQVTGNYFNQVRQAVPLERTAAATVTDQYQAAYRERQAQVAADAEARRMALANAALEQQMIREQMAREQELYDLQNAPFYQAIAEAMRKQSAANTWRDKYAYSGGWGW